MSPAAYHQWPAASTLVFVNNWLRESPVNLHFALFQAPASVETPTLAQRSFYGSYPPGAILPVYLLFKTVEILVPNIGQNRSLQILILIAWNSLLHLLLVLALCGMVFFLGHKMGFDLLNSTLLAIIPAIVQFHNAQSLYYHHIFYFADSAVLLPFVLYVFLELVRMFHASPLILRIAQALLMFYGVLTDWLFVFIVLTIYFMRLIRKEIALPLSFMACFRFLRHSVLFFSPLVLVIYCWLQQITYFGVGSGEMFTLLGERMGATLDLDNYLRYLVVSMFSHMKDGYGVLGMLLIYVTLYFTTSGKKFMSPETRQGNPATTLYLMLIIPCFIHLLFFLEHAWDHEFSALKFSPVLSIGFVILPILLLQVQKKSHLTSFVQLVNKKNISLVAMVGLTSAVAYGYFQVYDHQSITRFFSSPNHGERVIGNFIRENTSYHDVVFSKHYTAGLLPPLALHFTNKLVHPATNLDDVYVKTKDIGEDFTIKIFHIFSTDDKEKEMQTLADFMAAENLQITTEREGVLALQAFAGREFILWYENRRAEAVLP